MFFTFKRIRRVGRALRAEGNPVGHALFRRVDFALRQGLVHLHNQMLCTCHFQTVARGIGALDRHMHGLLGCLTLENVSLRILQHH